ncbi:hypothetical protein FSP39_018515 [Pinctada imbricata]|uniref:Uncharacterized protein n=1 Tax=Pinctada imbricata TaxID=66713 RepID=A0AA88XT66_PINIB|nr:hypothetical protein FSP39_018515 [Pinctada imbricata]
MDFYCPSNGYINGFYSVHNSEKEDRIMKFRCCNLPGSIFSSHEQSSSELLSYRTVRRPLSVENSSTFSTSSPEPLNRFS